MIPVDPSVQHPGQGARLVTFAANQPEYHPLPAIVDEAGLVLTEWRATPAELEQLKRGAPVRLWIWTHNRPLQPVALEVGEAAS